MNTEKAMRDLIAARDGHDCQYCGTTTAARYIVEHIIPRALGGPMHPANLVIACDACNRKKGRRIWVPRNLAHITAPWPRWRAFIEAWASGTPDVFSIPEAPGGPTLLYGPVQPSPLMVSVDRDFIRRPDLSPLATLIYTLLHIYKTTGEIMDQHQIGHECGVSGGTAKHALQELAAKGLITIRRRGQGLTNVYELSEQPRPLVEVINAEQTQA